MTLPVGAKVRAVRAFKQSLTAAHEFMLTQDERSAANRLLALQAGIARARAMLSFSPGSGRPARFLEAKTAWGRFQAEQARHLARQLGCPELREFVLERHVLLYAHSGSEVVLLSVRRERQLGYRPGQE
jgi:hypothetical protein